MRKLNSKPFRRMPEITRNINSKPTLPIINEILILNLISQYESRLNSVKIFLNEKNNSEIDKERLKTRIYERQVIINDLKSLISK
jgi:hypothetical protein